MRLTLSRPHGARAVSSLAGAAGVGVLSILWVAVALGWGLPFGSPTGNRVAAGKGTFPRWQAVALATEVPLRWIVALPPRRLAAVDRDGTLWIFELPSPGSGAPSAPGTGGPASTAAAGALTVAGRYGDVAGPDSPPVAVTLDRERSGVALVGRDGRLVIWSDGALRGYDVGAPLSRLTFPTPVMLAGREWDDLLAVAADGAVLLVGNLPAGPRSLGRAAVHALPDARVTVADLEGDGAPEAVVLAEATDRYVHGVLGDPLEAAAIAVISIAPHGLALRARHAPTGLAVYEDLVPVLATLHGGRRGVLVTRSTPAGGAAVALLGWRDGGLATLAESSATGDPQRWSHVVGAADVSGHGGPEVVAVHTPHLGGVLTAYRRQRAALVPVAQAPGYASHAVGSRNLDQALLADMDGNGRPEVVLPRQTRDVLAALEIERARLVERWSIVFRSAIESNLVAADLDGDGLLDLAVADRGGVYVFRSQR